VGGLAKTLLLESGHSVCSGRRRPTANDHLVDVLKVESFPPELGEADTVIYLVSADSFSDESYKSAYVEGLQNVVKYLNEFSDSKRKLIFVSSTGVYAQSQGEIVDEFSKTEPINFSGARLLEGEKLLSSFNGQATSLRFSGIYGPGRARMIDDLKAGKVFARSPQEVFSNRIHLEDCARQLLFLTERKAIDPCYIGSDEEPTKLSEILDWLSKKLGTPLKITEENQVHSPLRGNKRCSSALIRSQGFRFKYPTFREGFEAILS
jgi:nucleoside-diphosphate-sugar epimerase